MKMLGAFLVVALFVGAGIHTNDAASAQQRLAEGWSGDAAQFSATGLTGSTLHIALPGESQVACDALLMPSEAIQKWLEICSGRISEV